MRYGILKPIIERITGGDQMLSDIKIAQQASMQPIADIAAGLGID